MCHAGHADKDWRRSAYKKDDDFPQDFERLLPNVVQWVREVEAAILLLGEPLPAEHKPTRLRLALTGRTTSG